MVALSETPLRLEGGRVMFGNSVLASSAKDAAMVAIMKRLADWYPGDADMERRVQAVLRQLPAVLSMQKVTDVELLLASFYPDWDRSYTHNVAGLVYRRECYGSVGEQLSCTYISGSMSCFEKGECAKASSLDTSFPEAVQVEGLPTNVSFLDYLPIVEYLEKRECNFDLICNLEKGECYFTEFLNLTFPCAILKLRNCPLSLFTIGALIKRVDGSGSSYDDSLCVGELISEGEAFLMNSGPERCSIVLGITDMRTIQWYRISRSNVDGHLSVARGLATTDVIESICGFLHAKPSVLGVKTSLAIHRLPSSWRIIKHIGSGLTSHVYLVVSASSRLAVKVPQPGFNLSDDIQNLEALAGVDGVPKIHQKVHSMIALEPVGDLFSSETLGEYEAKGFRLSLVDLVVILECAHQRGIVNRDLRPENLMIGESLYNPGEPRLYILDWGFATKSNKACSFSGSVITASDLVLEQLSQQKQCALTRIVVSPSDDLVSLVRCLFLTFHFQIYVDLSQIGKDPERIQAFWKQQMECNLVWRKTEEDALHLQYESLKKFFSSMPEI